MTQTRDNELLVTQTRKSTVLFWQALDGLPADLRQTEMYEHDQLERLAQPDLAMFLDPKVSRAAATWWYSERKQIYPGTSL